ncbi:MAG: hypothetical protein RBU37_18655 [Myxococcota bacterium]|jgi:hypothetical protein|nr:hypothetical protein [Myxococcota bacterium]
MMATATLKVSKKVAQQGTAGSRQIVIRSAALKGRAPKAEHQLEVYLRLSSSDELIEGCLRMGDSHVVWRSHQADPTLFDRLFSHLAERPDHEHPAELDVVEATPKANRAQPTAHGNAAHTGRSVRHEGLEPLLEAIAELRTSPASNRQTSRALFDRYIMADYSGAADEAAQKDKICLIDVACPRQHKQHTADARIELEGGFTRETLCESLLQRLQQATERGERVLLGLDHQFSWPLALFALCKLDRACWRDAWDALVRGSYGGPPLSHPKAFAAAFNQWSTGAKENGPFYARTRDNAYGLPTSQRVLPAQALLRLCELTARRDGAKPRHALELLSQGSVAGQTICGMQQLHRLLERAAKRKPAIPMAVWPFDGLSIHDRAYDGKHVAVEIYPSAYVAAFEAAHGVRLEQTDARDAAISAWFAMRAERRPPTPSQRLEALMELSIPGDDGAAEHAQRASSLRQQLGGTGQAPNQQDLRLEGWILGVRPDWAQADEADDPFTVHAAAPAPHLDAGGGSTADSHQPRRRALPVFRHEPRARASARDGLRLWCSRHDMDCLGDERVLTLERRPCGMGKTTRRTRYPALQAILEALPCVPVTPPPTQPLELGQGLLGALAASPGMTQPGQQGAKTKLPKRTAKLAGGEAKLEQFAQLAWTWVAFLEDLHHSDGRELGTASTCPERAQQRSNLDTLCRRYVELLQDLELGARKPCGERNLSLGSARLRRRLGAPVSPREVSLQLLVSHPHQCKVKKLLI